MDSKLTISNPQGLETINENSKSKQLESFFDYKSSDPKNLRKLWTAADQNHENEIKRNILVEGFMEKQGRKTHSWKTRYYILTDEFLAYKEVWTCFIILHILLETKL